MSEQFKPKPASNSGKNNNPHASDALQYLVMSLRGEKNKTSELA